MECNYDKCGELGCLTCGFTDCIRNDIVDDAFIEEPPKQSKHVCKGIYTKYKKPLTDDERREKARIYQHNRKYGVPKEPRVFKKKGREKEYLREYRAQMPEEQRQKYLEKQREYNRIKRARAKQTA